MKTCDKYLKPGESPAECIARNRADVDLVLGLLAKEKRRNEELTAERDALLADKALLDWLEEHISKYGWDHVLGIASDEEDGVWLTEIEHGPHSGTIIEPLESGTSTTVREAIRAAMRSEE